MAEQMVGAVANQVFNFLTDIIKTHIRYITGCTKYVREMGTRMVMLTDRKRDVEKHVEINQVSHKVVPTHVPGWLKRVEDINTQVDNIHVAGCFNLKGRYKAGKRAFKIIEEIQRLLEEDSETIWTDLQIPLGRVGSQVASTSTTSDVKQNDFESRDSIFNAALKALKEDNKSSRMIALCGMGGVGKSTMMEQLKTAVEEKKAFDWVVKAVIGEKSDPIDRCKLAKGIKMEHLETKRGKLMMMNSGSAFMCAGGTVMCAEDVDVNAEDAGNSPGLSEKQKILSEEDDNAMGAHHQRRARTQIDSAGGAYVDSDKREILTEDLSSQITFHSTIVIQ